LTEKETTMSTSTMADTKTYAEILRDVPTFSSCAPDVLDHFVSRRAFAMHVGAGREILSRTDSTRNLFVLVAGSARLDAGDSVHVALEPGDYFGGDSEHHHHKLTASVVAVDDVEVLIVSPEEIVRLQQAGSRRHHPSNVDWSPEVAVPSLQLVPSRRRLGVLAGSAS
jgi:hypothetical protein